MKRAQAGHQWWELDPSSGGLEAV